MVIFSVPLSRNAESSRKTSKAQAETKDIGKSWPAEIR